ncbi:MAG: ABC transporter permease [Bryobacteraceae bacterium]
MLLEDARYAFRTLRKSPVFTTVALLSLALGIGANTAIFSLLDQVLLRLLPVREPQQLVILNQGGPFNGRVMGNNMFTYPTYRELRDQVESFDGILARFGTDASMSHGGRTEVVRADLVSGNFFQVLGVPATLGRTLTPEDDTKPGAHPVVVLSDGYWRRRFGGDPSILNATIRVNNMPMTVIGVSAAGFSGIVVGKSPDIMVPLMMKATMTPTWNGLDDRRSFWLQLTARVRKGISREKAAANLNIAIRPSLEEDLKVMQNMGEKGRERYRNKTLTLVDGGKGRSSLRNDFGTPLLVLMAMVGAVLLIACANVANLLLARAASRQKEIAVRLALGASRGRIVSQLLTEGLVLSIGGGLLGLIIAYWAGALLLSFLPGDEVTLAISTGMDPRVVLFCLGLSIVTGILFGLVPAIQASRPKLSATLKDQANNVSAAGGQVRLRRVLVAAQVALSLVLLIGAGLFGRSLYNLKNVQTGFQTNNLISFGVDASHIGYSSERLLALYDRIQEGLNRIPGVRAASLGGNPVLSDNTSMTTVDVEGYRAKEDENMNPLIDEVGPGYFQALGIPVILGREISAKDRLGAPRVAVVNEAFVKYFFGKDNPLGRRFGIGREGEHNIEIVGVCKDARIDNVREATIPRRYYLSYLQDKDIDSTNFYVRTNADPEKVFNAAREVVRNTESELPITGMKTMQVQIDELLFIDRLIAALSLAFGALATLLAAIGLYGVMAYSVARRTREIGVRMALGAEPGQVRWMVLKEVLVLAAIGFAVALPASYGLGRYVGSQLFGITPNDPWVMALATLALAVVALVAGYLPARRATRIDPINALRYE